MAKGFIVYSSTKAKFKAQVANGTVDATQIGIIGDTAEVWINGAYHPIAPLLDYAKRSEVVAGYLPKNALSVEPSEHNFTWRVATGDSKLTDSLAVVNKLLGRTVKWNQLIDRCASVTDNARQVTVSYNSSNEIIINNTSPKSSDYSQVTIFGNVSSKKLIEGHKYLICADRAHLGVGITEGDNSTPFHHVNSVFSANNNIIPRFAISPSYDFSVEHSYTTDGSSVRQPTVPMKLNLFDLTEMFGSGNEPQSLGEFRKLYPKAYYAPCITPQTVGVKIEALPLASYNLWNKDEAVQGAIMYDTGWMRSDAYYRGWWTYIIPVAPNTRYYLLNVANRSQCMPCVYYGEDMTQLRDTNGNVAEGISHAGPQSLDTSTDYVSGEVLTPADAAYMAVMVHNTYKDKACVSVSSRRNSDYEAYIASGAPLTLEDADGNELFPHGLLATADGVADEVGEGYALQRVTYDTAADGTISNLRQVEIVNSAGNTVKGFKYSPINTRLWMTWRVRRGATEKVTLSDVSAPFRASISYALDVNDLLPAPLEDKRDVYMKILAMDENGRTYRSANYARSYVDIDYGSVGYIPDCKIVKDYVGKYVSENYPTTVATAPVRTILSDTPSASHTLELSPNVVYEHTRGYFFMSLVIYLLNPSDYYAHTWTLRLIPSGTLQKITFPNITIKWVNGAPPTGTNSNEINGANVLEIVIRQSMTFYIGEWKIYK